MATVRGITSRVDIVWSSDDTEVQRMDNTTLSTLSDHDSPRHTDSYFISQLNTSDDGKVIQCKVVINSTPLVMASDNITLDVTGEHYIIKHIL